MPNPPPSTGDDSNNLGGGSNYIVYDCRINEVLIPLEKCVTLFLQSLQLFNDNVD